MGFLSVAAMPVINGCMHFCSLLIFRRIVLTCYLARDEQLLDIFGACQLWDERLRVILKDACLFHW